MKKFLLALFVLTALLCLVAYGFLHQAEQRMEQALLDGLPHIFSRQGQPAAVTGEVEASLLAGRISLRDLDIRQPSGGLRLQVSELSVKLNTEHLHATLQALEGGQGSFPGEERGPLVLDDVILKGARLQTAEGAWSAQRQHITHLEISPSLLWALDRGTATLETFRKGVSFSGYAADFCDYDAPSLLAPLRLGIRELTAEALADGKLLRLEGEDITLVSAPYTVECHALRHAALPLADMLDAPDMLASLTRCLVPASVAARNLPSSYRGDNGWSLEDVRCRLADAPLFAIEHLSWEKDADLDGRNSQRRLEGGRLYADTLASALRLKLPAGAVWHWDMSAQSQVTDEGTVEQLNWRSSLAACVSSPSTMPTRGCWRLWPSISPGPCAILWPCWKSAFPSPCRSRCARRCFASGGSPGRWTSACRTARSGTPLPPCRQRRLLPSSSRWSPVRRRCAHRLTA